MERRKFKTDFTLERNRREREVQTRTVLKNTSLECEKKNCFRAKQKKNRSNNCVAMQFTKLNFEPDCDDFKSVCGF